MNRRGNGCVSLTGLWAGLLVLSSALMGCEVVMELGPDPDARLDECVQVIRTPQFNLVSEGQAALDTLELRNQCERDIVLLSLRTDEPEFEAVGQGSWPMTLAAGAPFRAEIRFTPAAAGTRHSTLVVDFMAGQAAFSHAIDLRGNAGQACLDSEPLFLDFGSIIPGGASSRTLELSPCGSEPLRLMSEAPLLEGSAVFTLETLSSQENGKVLISMRYEPQAAQSELSSAQEDLGLLTLKLNTYEGHHVVMLRGVAVSEACPHAVARASRVGLVGLGENISLDGNESAAAKGEIIHYSWTVRGPAPHLVTWAPSQEDSNPTVSFGAYGDYVIGLEVTEDGGDTSCAAAELNYSVRPGEGLVVMLTWVTPTSAENTGGLGRGTDLDLHVVHPLAAGEDVDGDGVRDGWFDRPFDVFWDNTHPDWGLVGVIDDDPRLHRDDFDGGGPEVVHVPTASGLSDVRVGVHFWSDHGFGPVDATLSVWHDDVLLIEAGPTAMTEGDLWRVGRFDFDALSFEPSSEAFGGIQRGAFPPKGP